MMMNDTKEVENQMFALIVLYLAWCLSGFWAVMRFFTEPSMFDGAWVDGIDVTIAIFFGIAALLPPFSVAANLFWFTVLWRKWQKFRDVGTLRPPRIAFKAKHVER